MFLYISLQACSVELILVRVFFVNFYVSNLDTLRLGFIKFKLVVKWQSPKVESAALTLFNP